MVIYWGSGGAGRMGRERIKTIDGFIGDQLSDGSINWALDILAQRECGLIWGLHTGIG